MSEPFKAAVIPAARVLFGTRRIIDKVADLVGEAASEGARLVVLPEAFVGGYPRGWISARGLARAAPTGARNSGATMKVRLIWRDRRLQAAVKGIIRPW
ncbi:nitrilase-related carbon-nitrogen hydrolase [Martelella sp. FLE1502]